MIRIRQNDEKMMALEGFSGWEFEGFFLESGENGCLWLEGKEVHLAPKALEILRMLVDANGAVVSRADLLAEVWRGTFVEEGNINYTISSLRKSLRKASGSRTEFIRTVPKHGYRFVPEIAKPQSPAKNPPVASIISGSRLSGWKPYALLSLFCVFFFTSFGIWWQIDRGPGLSSVPLGDRVFSSLAVLPPRALNGGDREGLLGVAVADTLSSRLGSMNFIAVRPIGRAMEFRSSGLDELAFGRALEADAVLSGTYLRSGKTVRMNFRLQDTRDGAVVWTGKVDVSDSDLLRVQEIVSATVASEIAKAFEAPKPGIKSSLTDNSEAYRLYLRGRYLLKQRDANGESPLDLFQKAVKLDPGFAEAYVGIADSLAFLEPPQPELERSLETAISLDPELADAWATRGFVRMFHHWDWSEAGRSFHNAIRLQPYNGKARHWYGTYLTLTGDLEGARSELLAALDLDPGSVFIRSDIAMLHYYAGRFDEAENAASALASLDPGGKESLQVLSRISFARGDRRKGFEYFVRSLNADPELKRELLHALASSGDTGLLSRWSNELKCNKNGPSLTLSCPEILMLKGEEREAIDYLNRAVDRRLFLLPYINIDPFWTELKGDPDFEKLIERMGLRIRKVSYKKRPESITRGSMIYAVESTNPRRGSWVSSRGSFNF